MTLHEAIIKVLEAAGRNLTAREIADEINSKALYVRKDKNPVPASQISARVNNYPEKFSKNKSKIGLFSSIHGVFGNFRSQKPLELKDTLEDLTKELFNNHSLTESESVLFVCALSIVAKKNGVEFDLEGLPNSVGVNKFNSLVKDLISEDHILSEVLEILVKQKSILTQDFFNKISFDISYLIYQTSDDEFNEIIINYLNNVGLFGKRRFLEQFHTPDFINKILVELADPKDNDIVLDPAAGVGKTLIEVIKRNKNVQVIGQEIDYNFHLINKTYFYLEKFNSYKLYCTDSLKNPKIEPQTVDLIISDIPFGIRINNADFDFPKSKKKGFYYSEELFIEFMLSRLNSAGRIITTIPLGLLSSLSTTSLREALVEKDFIESIILLPQGANYPYSGVSPAILTINKNKRPERSKKIIFIDLNKGLDIQVCNNKLEIKEKHLKDLLKNISLFFKKDIAESDVLNHFIATKKLIIEQDYNLSPKRYNSEVLDLLNEVSHSERLVQLDEVLDRIFTSDRFSTTEDLKFIQLKDLNDSPIEFYLDLKKPKTRVHEAIQYRVIVGPALLLSRIGDKIKPTYFENSGQAIGINTSILAFRVKKEIVNIEYLITQLNSDFFQKQLDLIISENAIQTITPGSLLKLKIPVPPLSEQYNRLALYKEQYSNRLTLTQFINDIRLVSTNQEIKNEIERFSQKTLPLSNYISFKREFEFDKLPFSRKEIEETMYIKRSKEGHYFNLLLHDQQNRVNGILIVESELEISFEQYSAINAYTNFILQTSSKYVQENTNKLLNEFSHTTKNILKDINKIIGDFLDTPNEEFRKSMKNSLIKDEEMINYFIKTENKKREDFLAYNRLGEAYSIVNRHLELFKRRHEYYTKSVNTKAEEIELSAFLKRVPFDNTRIHMKNQVNTIEFLHIKTAPMELAFADLINNATTHSNDGKVYVSIDNNDRFIQFIIRNKAAKIMSKDNYEILGLEDIKKADGTYSTGLSHAFRCINENNDISLAPYEKYRRSKNFEIIIKLKKK